MKKRKILQRIDTPSGRAYMLESDGKHKFLPSVTSVLSLKSSTYLAELEEKIPKDELKKISERAARRGTAMHKFLENYLVCVKHKGESEACLYYTQRKSTDSLLHDMEKERVDKGRLLFYNIYHSGILKSIKKVLFTEQFLYSEMNKFAGTTDFGYVDMNNQIVVTDFKSASSPRTKDVVDKYKCQVAAYSLAFEEMFKKPVSRGEIWISYEDGLQLEIVEGVELEEKKKEFIDLCETYHSMWDIKPFEDYLLKTK